MQSVRFNESLWFAIAEPSRRYLIELLLSKGEASASNLAKDVPISRQAVVKHLAVLKEAGLVKSKKLGKEVRFSVVPGGITEASAEMSQAASLWDERLNKIKLIAERLNQEE